MPDSEQITHTALAIQIARVEGSLNTITTLLAERNKSHNELADSHKTLSKTVEDLKVRVIQISTVGAILASVMPGIWDRFLDRGHHQKDSGAIVPPALVRGRG